MTILNTPPPNRVAIGTVESPNGPLSLFISTEWARYFETLTSRVGGTTGPSTTDLATSAFEDAGTEETKAEMQAFMRSIDQAPRYDPQQQIADLETQTIELFALVGELRRELFALQQGYTV